MSKHENWTCPFCKRDQIVVPSQMFTETRVIRIENHRYGEASYSIIGRGCANAKCREIALSLRFGASESGLSGHTPYVIFKSKAEPEFHRIRPKASLNTQPAAVPDVLARDYYEACAIRDLSPKASATLSRRVLQGMIRDFCGITRTRLIDEINALKTLADEGKAPRGVDPDTIDAMQNIRKIGNIGAHMEGDINVIVDVEPNEAQLLIELVEMLFKDWYVAKAQREERLAALKQTAAQKDIDKKQAAAAAQVAVPASPNVKP